MKSRVARFLQLRPSQYGITPTSVIPSAAGVPSAPVLRAGVGARDLLFLILVLAGSLTLCLSANAQQAMKAMPSDAQLLQTYNANREIQLIGTVVKYETASAIPPMGAHVTVQTPSGQVDVHLGNARILQAAHLELNAGDNVRIVGEPMALGDGTYFAARILQKGTQAVAVRNAKGFPLRFAGPLTPAEKQALRGVR